MIVGGATFSTAIPVGSGQAPAAPVTAVAAASGSGVAIADARRQALLRGATPATALERQWIAQVGQALQGYVAIVGQLVREGARQAALGRDLNGNPLQAREDHAYEQRVLELVNQQRAAHGLPALAYDRRLDLASERHNERQAATRTMAHEGIGDGDPGSRIQATGFNRSWGENVATGQRSPEQVVAEWMASPGHRRNILDADFRLMGVSYAVGADGRSYWAQSFGAA